MRTVFLQISDYDTKPIDPVMFYGIIIIGVVIGIFITRAIFSIPTFLKYQKMQTLLLMKFARANGITEKEI